MNVVFPYLQSRLKIFSLMIPMILDFLNICTMTIYVMVDFHNICTMTIPLITDFQSEAILNDDQQKWTFSVEEMSTKISTKTDFQSQGIIHENLNENRLQVSPDFKLGVCRNDFFE